MYSIRASRNPSCWLGPVWGVSNYLVFRGLVNYGFESEAAELAEKTIKLFGGDIRRSGTVHEYYQPGNGVPICNEDFLNWNLLCMNVIAWHEKQNVVVEY
jgi:putative isomerase